MDENPFGWQTIVFSFQEGESEATVEVNDLRVAIGLDHYFRFIQTGENPFPQGFRGTWKNKDTFFVETIELGQPTHTQTTILFSEDTIQLLWRDESSGSEVEIQGRLADEG